MGAKNHQDITAGAPANAAVWNVPLGQLDDAIADLQANFGDYVVSGGLPGTSASLVISQPAIRAWVLGIRVSSAATLLTATATSDNYVDYDTAGLYHVTPVANGAAAPPVFAQSIRLYVAVTNATAVTSIVDLRPQPASAGIFVNVKLSPYLAKGDGVTNDAPAIQAAINAVATAGGGVVFVPPGTYLCSSTLSISGDYVILRGAGWKSVIKAANGLNADILATPSGALAVRNYIGIEHLAIDGNRANQSAGHAMHLYGLRYSYVDRVFVQNAYGQAFLLDSDPAAIGYQNAITRCVVDTSGGCVYENGQEGNFFAYNIWKWTDSQQMMRCEKGAHVIHGNIFGGGGTYTVPALHLRNNLPSKVTSNRFDKVRRVAIQLDAGNNIVENNELYNPGQSATNTYAGIAIGGGITHSIIRGNVITPMGDPVTYSYAIQDQGDYSLIEGNQLVAGGSGVIALFGPPVNSVVKNNLGFNPQGVAAITVGASPFTYTNQDSVSEAIYIVAGTVSQVVKNGITIFVATGCTVWLEPNEAVTVTYSSAPSMWKDRK